MPLAEARPAREKAATTRSPGSQTGMASGSRWWARRGSGSLQRASCRGPSSQRLRRSADCLDGAHPPLYLRALEELAIENRRDPRTADRF